MIITKKQGEMLNNLQELMTIMMEECGELIQQCSKSIRSDNYYDNEKLTEEVGDVMCMIDLLHEYDIISWTDVDKRVLEKKKKLQRWSNLYE
jgi:NTP pyrophosphatase (non-canonical NTP hydrolase)